MNTQGFLRAFVVMCLIGGLVGVFVLLSKQENDIYRWETSPCGTKLFSGNYYVLGNYYTSDKEEIRNKFFDDGKRVWEIYQVTFPDTIESSEPVIKWRVAMERAPEACAEWKKKTGIEFPQ